MSGSSEQELDARLRRAIGAAAGNIAEAPDSRWLGRLLGQYRIESRIAAGGMGVVFRGRRADAQFERDVAIKLLNQHLPSDDARRRFLAERQILADLNHPGIAQLLDGGTTEEGLPYLVMEFIDGLPIGDFCAQHELPVSDRIRLFNRVCEAVQFAHQHLVVHRDIKTSNILVTADAVPKLLDFGIAKLLSEDGRQPNLTLADARMLTPRNASPEQLRGAPITTVSDIYSLGVLLYELLTGRSPYPSDLTPFNLERAICDDEPGPEGLEHGDLTGDLEVIIQKAMRKDPARRYATARELSEDLERHLSHRPVLARPESLGYRAGKFLRRNAWITGAAAATLLVFVTIVTFYTQQLAQERAELARASTTSEEVSRLLVEMFEGADPTQTRPDVTVREVLDGGATRIAELRVRQPVVAARLMVSSARAYAGLGMFQRARELIEEALTIRRSLLAPGDPAIAEALHYLGVVQTQMREHDAALATLEEALRLREQALEVSAMPVGETLFRIGFLQHRRGNYPAMGVALKRALPIYERVLGPDHPQLVEVLGVLGVYQYLVNENEASRATLLRGIVIGEREFGRDSIRLATLIQALGRLEWQLGNFGEAVNQYSRVLAIRENHLGPMHPDVGVTLYGLAVSTKDQGAFRESRAYYDRVIQLQEKVLGPDDFFLALSYAGDGFLKLELGELEGARHSMTRALAIAEKRWGPSHPDLRAPLAGLAKVLIELGEFEPALDYLERARLIVEEQFPEDHIDVLRTWSSIATLHRRRGDFSLARPLFERTLAGFERGVGTKHPFATESLIGMAEVLKAANDLSSAEPYYEAAMRNMAGPNSDKRRMVADCLVGFADLFRRTGRTREANEAIARSRAIYSYLRAEGLSRE